MTITDIMKRPKSGARIKRASSTRVLVIGPGKAGPFLLCTEAGDSAPMFTDDLAADDWGVVDDAAGKR